MITIDLGIVMQLAIWIGFVALMHWITKAKFGKKAFVFGCLSFIFCKWIGWA